MGIEFWKRKIQRHGNVSHSRGTENGEKSIISLRKGDLVKRCSPITTSLLKSRKILHGIGPSTS